MDALKYSRLAGWRKGETIENCCVTVQEPHHSCRESEMPTSQTKAAPDQ